MPDEIIPIEEADQVAAAKKAPAKKASRAKSPVAKQRKPPTDLTGAKLQEQAEALAAEQAEAAERLTMVNTPAVVFDESDEVVDYTGGQATEPVPSSEPEDLLEDDVVITVSADLTDLTYGAGTLYTFRAGKRYKVPRSLAEWLDERGYIWR